jgi:hypothetical protein
MKKIHLFILFLLGFVACFGQFDRLNTNPMHLHSAFVGSAGTSRVGIETGYASDNYYPSQAFRSVLTYDALINPLKGGLGISIKPIWYDKVYYNSDSTTRHDVSNAFNVAVSYAPKFTFGNEVTWSPSFRIDYGHYRVNSRLNLALGLLRNTKKTFYGVEYTHRVTSCVETERCILNELSVLFGIKFNKKQYSATSSTLIIKQGISREYFPGLFSNPSYVDYFLSSSSHIEYNLRIKKFLFILSPTQIGLGAKTKNFGIQFLYGQVDSDDSVFLYNYYELSYYQLNASIKFK